MTDSPARVTVVGVGRKHLHEREQVLRHFWEVELVIVDEGGELSLDTELVLLCHTLPELERQQWVERVRDDAPKMLVIKMNDHDSGHMQGLTLRWMNQTGRGLWSARSMSC